MGILSKVFSGGVGDLVEKVGGVVDKFVTTGAEKETMKQEMLKLVNDHQEKMATLAQAELDSYLKDMESARNMQVEALKQGDIFSKRFIYYLAMGVIIIVAAFDFLMFFVKYPLENRDMINMIAGILNSTALVMVLSFFFGSSKGSKDAGERMDKMMDKVVAK